MAVFDYYNVLTSNAGDVDTNDAGQVSGNHHRWWNGAVQHVQTVSSNTSAYASGGDSHPTAAGQQKAAAEFVSLLNVFYHRWQAGSTPAPALTLTAPNSGAHWPVNSSQQIRWTTTGAVMQVNLSCAIDGVTTTLATNLANSGVYTWDTPATATSRARVSVESVVSPTTVYNSVSFILCEPADCAYLCYLPLVFKD